MLFRLPILLVFVLSLAFGPVQWSAACAVPANDKPCMGCCEQAEMACCVPADQSTRTKTTDSVAPQSVDAKLLVSPQFVVVTLCPLPVVERPSFLKLQAARMPALPRLDLTCIRLI